MRNQTDGLIALRRPGFWTFESLAATFVLSLVALALVGSVGAAFTTATVATDAATGFNSLATSGAQKLLEDSYGKMIAVYVDTLGKLAITYDNSDPTVAGTWATPWKSLQPTAVYARPAAVLVSPTLLRIIVEGGSAAGRITDIPVSIQRDSQGNILGFIGGTATTVDGSGLAKFPSAILAHNGDILAAWNWVNGTESSRVKTARWQPATGWGTFAGGPGVDDAIVDRSSVSSIISSLIEREDNFNIYLIASRGGVSKLAFNEAVFGSAEGGANWSWGTQNLAYEANVSSGSEDAVSVAWDNVRNVVVAAYGLGNFAGYGVFRLNALDQKTHMDTPSIVKGDKDWGTIVVHPPTGDYFLFLIAASVDAGSGPVAFTRFASGSWNSTLTVVDSETTNQGLAVRKIGDPESLDILYAKGTSGQRQVRFFRLIPSGKLAATLTVKANPNPSNPGDLVQVSGILAEEINGTAIPARPVAVQQSTDQVNWNTVSATITDLAGHYMAVTTFPANGLYYIQTVFAGDNAFQPVTSPTLYEGVGTFIFSSAGDVGASARTTLSLGKLAFSGSHFFLAVGDLSYSQITPESGWCDYIHAKLGDDYPFELLSGNHEDGREIQDGLIDNFAACLPDKIGGVNGVYAKEYYFDYPLSRPLARFILISPNLNFTNGGYYNYNAGAPRYSWVSSTIDNARTAGIPWVVVGMHKDCITLGINNCEIGPDLMNLFISKRVDLVLQGHDHLYARSKQLTCAAVNVYLPSCVANDGSNGSYVRGAGTVFIIEGNIGQGQHFVNVTDTEAPYFIRATGANGYWNGAGAVTPGVTYGFVKFTVTATQIRAEYVNSTGPFTDSFTITNTNTLPVLQLPGPQTVNEGSPLSFTASASDADSQQLVTLSASGLIAGMTCHTATGNPVSTMLTWTPSEGQGPGDYTVTFTADDGNSGVVSSTVSIHVTEVNTPPALTILASQTVNEETTLTFVLAASDADVPANTITLSASGLPTGAVFDPSTGTFTWTPSEGQGPGDYDVAFSATDNGSPQMSSSATVAIHVNEVNEPPSLSRGRSSGVRTIDELTTLSFTVTASDPDLPANNLTFSSGAGAPVGSSITNAGVFSWTPSESQGPGTYTITIIVTDNGNPALSDSLTLTVNVNEVNTGPTVTVPGSLSVNEGSVLSFIVNATDADIPTNTITLSVSGEPGGATFNTATGVFSWTPSEAQGPGDYTVIITATDNGNPQLADTKSVTVHVNEVNQPPNLSVPPGQSVALGDSLTFTVNATDQDVPTNVLSLNASGLPSGSSFNPSNGVFTFTPTSSQVGQIYTVIFSASDNGSPSLTNSNSVNILVGSNQPPTIQPINDQLTDEQHQLTFAVTATDPDPDQTITLGATSLPPGASFTSTPSSGTVTGTFTWMPDELQGPGTYMITFYATDGIVSVFQNVTTVVNEVNRAPVISPVSSRTVNENSALTFTVSATDTDVPSNNIALSASGLPQGASFNTLTGLFQWTPGEAQGPGDYSVTFTATDNGSPQLSGSISVSIHINEVNTAPALTVPGSMSVNELNPLAFSVSASDPDIPANSITLACSNCGVLGATFNPTTGQFSWTPSEAQGPGDYTFTFTAADDGTPSLSDSKAVTVHVSEVNTAPSLTTPPSLQTTSPGGTLTFTVTATDSDAPPNTVTISSTGLVTGMSFTGGLGNPAVGTFIFTPSQSQAGNTYTITFTSVDNGNPLLSSQSQVTISVIRQTYALVVSTDGKVWQFYPNGTLRLLGQPTTSPLRQVAWKPDGSYALIVGDKATLIKYDGTFTAIPTGVAQGVNLWTITWKPDGSYALIGGTSGILLKYNGASAVRITNPYQSTIFSISWQPSGSYALMVGKNGLMLTYDGTTIRTVSTGTNADLNTVAWNPTGVYALAGGTAGVILRYNGTINTPLNTTGIYSSTISINGISWNSAGSLALLAGDSGLLLSYNGSSLTKLVTPTGSFLYGAAWLQDSATIVGSGGTMLSYSGGTVRKVTTNTTFTFRSISWLPG